MVFCRKCGAENKPGNKFCIKCGSALAPAKRGVDIDIKTKYYFVGSLITSLLGAILLLFGEFGSWTITNSWWDPYREQYEYEYSYNSIGALYPESPLFSLILLCLVALLIYGAYVSYLGLRFSGTLSQKKLKRAFYGATTVFLVCIISGMIFVSNMNLQEGFYGGFIFGGLTAGLLAIPYRRRR